MVRPRLLDLFCKAGGTSMGYHMAGFDVTGVDIEPQPNYPFEFIKADALTFPLKGYDAYGASPPCQGYSNLQYRQDGFYSQLIYQVRERLRDTYAPFVIENVEPAKAYMYDPITLCGSSFALRCRRHRVFETNFNLPPVPCEHAWQDKHQPYKVFVGRSREKLGYRMSGTVPVHGGNQIVGGQELLLKSVALGIDWMTPEELNQAIPPVYTAYIGKHLMKVL